MKRRTYLATGAAALSALAGCSGEPASRPATTTASGPPPGTPTNPSFEAGLTGWEVGRDLPEDPNDPGSSVDNNTAVSDRHAVDGTYSVEFFIDGVADDGTLWVEQRIDLSDASTLAVAVYSPEESFNTLTKVAAYAGPNRSTLREEDFDTSAAVEDHEGWKTYEYAVDAVVTGLVAVGISVVWETGVTRWIDDVRLRPAGTG